MCQAQSSACAPLAQPLGAASASTLVSTTYAMRTLLALTILGTTICFPCHASDVYKWTDERGQVHYSDSIPEGRRNSVKGIPVNAGVVSDADRSAAATRLAKYREDLARISPSSAPVPTSATASSSTRLKPKKTPCEEAWDAYNESYACFDPYRMGNGTIRLEAFQRCKEVNRPPEACR
jgi:hypothetical protein